MIAATDGRWPRIRFDFSGCHVLVTGGTSGIGHAIAVAFAEAGAAVTITGTRARAADYDRDLGRFAYRALALTDVAAIDVAVESLPSLDVLVNNAGAVLPGGRSEYDPAVFEEALRINLSGAFRLAVGCQPTLAASRLEGGASIINLASMASYFGIVMVPGYGAAKAGIVQMTKSLAAAWARDGVRVNAIAPGHVSSAMTAPLEASPRQSQPILERTPMRRWGQPHEIAGAALFLASPAAAFITGQTLAVDGGYSIA